jgi:hypothetical protein
VEAADAAFRRVLVPLAANQVDARHPLQPAELPVQRRVIAVPRQEARIGRRQLPQVRHDDGVELH